MYDFIIVGSGLFGAVFANEAKKIGYQCLVVEKRGHIGGNVYTQKIESIDKHIYGAHIFHTSQKEIWDYVNSITPFTPFINSPKAYFKGKLYSLPFNMNTFYQLWGVIKPEDALEKIKSQKAEITTVTNLEEQAISLVGRDIYETLIKGYTEKQWGRDCKELPPEIIKRLPVRFTFDNNYFNDIYQGIPNFGYTKLIENLLNGVDVILNENFLDNKSYFEGICKKKIIYTGTIDSYFEYSEGELEYRSLKFEDEIINCENFQGVAVINYTEKEVPYTRIIEHKHFLNQKSSKTILTKEYPLEGKNNEPYYPIGNEKNLKLFEKYKNISKKYSNVVFGGRLGQYKYYDMDKVIESSLKTCKEIL